MAFRRRRRSFSRSRAGTKNGRRYSWIRFTPFGVQLQEATTATHSSILITETDWADPTTGLNDTRRGGARLERLIVEFGLALDADDGFWAPSGEGNIDIIPEFIIHKQTDQVVSVVTNSSSFASTRANQRIIMDTIPEMGPWNSKDLAPGGRSIRSVRGRYETKSKVRLAEGALYVSWRGLFDEGSENLNGYTDWVRPTMLISQP